MAARVFLLAPILVFVLRAALAADPQSLAPHGEKVAGEIVDLQLQAALRTTFGEDATFSVDKPIQQGSNHQGMFPVTVHRRNTEDLQVLVKKGSWDTVRKEFYFMRRVHDKCPVPRVDNVVLFSAHSPGVMFSLTPPIKLEAQQAIDSVGFVVMENLSGRKQVARDATLTVAVHCVHKQGIIHGDVKPDNFVSGALIDFDGSAQCFDTFTDADDALLRELFPDHDLLVLKGRLLGLTETGLGGARFPTTAAERAAMREACKQGKKWDRRRLKRNH